MGTNCPKFRIILIIQMRVCAHLCFLSKICHRCSLSFIDFLEFSLIFMDFYWKPLNSLRNSWISIQNHWIPYGIHGFLTKTIEFLKQFIGLCTGGVRNSRNFASWSGPRTAAQHLPSTRAGDQDDVSSQAKSFKLRTQGDVFGKMET